MNHWYWLALIGLCFGVVSLRGVSADDIPVHDYSLIYVLFGPMPPFLKVNIELAARRNPVIIVSDSISPHYDYKKTDGAEYRVSYLSISEYAESQNKFKPFYKHLSKDHHSTRIAHESQCFERWFILNDVMQKKNITHAMFGDGDTAFFVDAKSAWELRKNCAAVFNVDVQRNMYYWAGAGESSLWTQRGIAEFCRFTVEMYTEHLPIVAKKHEADRSSVVDMSLLWLWWVAHYGESNWESGRPFISGANNAMENSLRATHDESFKNTKRYKLASVDDSLHLCNGLDVVNRTTFDHMLGWEIGNGFNLDLDGSGQPFSFALANSQGGKPETLDPDALKEIAKNKLLINNIHYQGFSKQHILYDICRILLLTGPKGFMDAEVAELCNKEKQAHSGWPCINHSRNHCV